MLQLPRAILLDLDDTIISAYGGADVAWSAVLREFAHLLAPLRSDAVLSALLPTATAFWADAARHRIWRQKIRDARREIVALTFSELARQGEIVPSAEIQHRLADRFSDYRNENLRLFDDSHATIDSLNARGVKLALVTNGSSEDQRAKIARFNLAERFHHIQIEGELGFGKPEPRAYLHALQVLGVSTHETWMAGDNLEWDVAAPQKLGIHAIWYNPQGAGLPADSNVRPDRIVCRLSELLV